LIYAATGGKVTIMETTELLRRIENGRTDLILPLLASADGDATLKSHGAKLLEWCSYFGDVTACRSLLRHGQSLPQLGPDFGLNGAAFHGHWQLCEFLIESGANPNYVDPQTGETPLHSAVTNDDRLRYDLVVAVLLRAGADANAATIPDVETGSFMRDCRTRGETPLHRAAAFGTPATIEMLLAAGADRERKDARGESPLAWASWARRPTEVLRPLLYGPHRINAKNRPMRANLLGDP
jgi:ankyrin repeat protein